MATWAKIEELFHQVIGQNPSDREEFLRKTCEEDAALYEEVRTLLECDQGSRGFLETAALELVARQMASDLRGSLIGRRLGSFKVKRILDAGGMAAVYEGEHCASGRKAALKVVSATVDDPSEKSQVRRFLRECKTLSRLNHPNIVRVLEAGHAEDVLYLAMELVDGEPLYEAMENRGVDEGRIVEIAGQVASALAEVHARGILHRDIKPANLLLDRNGHVRLIDFGLVKKSLSAGVQSDLSLSTDSLTLTGTCLGTIDYMSPEQALGRELDPRSDIYSLGVVLYELATGRRPVEGLNPGEKVAQIIRGNPARPSLLRPGISARLETLIVKCLERKPERRFQSGQEILDFLERREQPENPSLLRRIRSRFGR